MHNPSDHNRAGLSFPADAAQILRGLSAFGAVAYHDAGALSPDQIVVEPGYADCLPLQCGGMWRDPSGMDEQEMPA